MPIREITSADKAAILALDREIFAGVDGGWGENDFNHYFSPHHCFAFYPDNNPDVIVGFIFTRPLGNCTHISNIGVKKEYEGKGIGKELMKTAMLLEYEASKTRPYGIALQVLATNERAIHFYQRFGYQETSRSEKWVQMKAQALPRQFYPYVSLRVPPPPKPSPVASVILDKVPMSATKSTNYSFSWQVVLGLGTSTVGLAAMAVGLLLAMNIATGIGGGLLVLGVAGILYSQGFFAKKPAIPLDDNQPTFSAAV